MAGLLEADSLSTATSAASIASRAREAAAWGGKEERPAEAAAAAEDVAANESAREALPE